MVFGSQSSRVATYSIPPCPSLAASMAAYRLRSFSESESWNIRMECSISGLYIMGGRPLRDLDGPCYGYTVRTENREVIKLAILNQNPGKSRSLLGPQVIQSAWNPGNREGLTGTDGE